MTNAVENVSFINVFSPLPKFKDKKRRVPVCKILLSTVNIETNPPTTLFIP